MAPVKMYTLSTCGHCRSTKSFMKTCGAPFEAVDVDLLEGHEREKALAEVRAVNPRLSFPTIIIGDTVIVGFKEAEIREALGL